MTDAKLWLLSSYTWNYFIVQKGAKTHLRMLSTKCVNKLFIYLIYMYREFDIK